MVSLQSPLLFHLAFAVLMIVTLTYQLTCPYTKVEESFFVQAIHDLYYYGVGPAYHAHIAFPAEITTDWFPPYDHWQYPGVVPRSFVGPLVLATLCRGVAGLLRVISAGNYELDDHPLVVQALARSFLLMFVLHGWYRLATALQQRMAPAGTLLLLLTATQFHLTFYASRPLANTLATAVCLHAWTAWVQSSRSNNQPTKIRQAAVCLIVATAVFRCDVLLLLGTAGLTWLATGKMSIGQALRWGISTGIVTLLVTVPLDTLLWQEPKLHLPIDRRPSLLPVWPEGMVFYYNAILGQSENWGTSPWYWYITSALPKSLLTSAAWIPFCLVRQHGWSQRDHFSLWWDFTWSPYVFTLTGFIALYSCLGHKEVRFLLPALPLANVLSAVGWTKWYHWGFPGVKAKQEDPTDKNDQRKVAAQHDTGHWWKRIVFVSGGLLCMINAAASVSFVAVSQQNYPGGMALEHLATVIGDDERCIVYIDNAAAMTGVSLFGQRCLPPQCSVLKAGYENQHQDVLSISNTATHLITEDSALGGDDFVTIQVIPGNPRLDWRRTRIETSAALYIRQRKQQ